MDNLLQVYQNDEFFIKLKETYNKWKNHTDRTRHIANSERELYLLILLKRYTKISDIVFLNLCEVNFKSRESFKLWLVIYRRCMKKNKFSITFKKEYVKKMARIKNRMAFERALSELVSKKMINLRYEDAYFIFEPNLAFLEWDISESEKQGIRNNINREINFCQEIIDNGRLS